MLQFAVVNVRDVVDRLTSVLAVLKSPSSSRPAVTFTACGVLQLSEVNVRNVALSTD